MVSSKFPFIVVGHLLDFFKVVLKLLNGPLAVGVLEGPCSAPVLLWQRLRVDVLVQALVRAVEVDVLLKLKF